MLPNIRKALKNAPLLPGVYIHKSAENKIIYVGKAAVLKNRLSQYFQPSTLKEAKLSYPKLAQHISQIADIEWIETESELDALFLEAELVKRYKPKYNILLQDDKSELFVRIDINSTHPTVRMVRRPIPDGAKYFGPYFDGWAVKNALKILRKIFPYDAKPTSSSRVSLDYHLGLSPGLEEGKTTLSDYRTNLKYLISYLKGNRVKLIKQLEADMKQAALAKNFEQAAMLRNKISALKALRKQVVFGREEFMDIAKDKALSGMAKLLELPEPPKRIEGYDISHMSGTDNTASMVVFSNGLPDKSQYRKFKMRLAGNDDFAHMKEVISRRFSSGNQKKWGLPDLILIDGGKGQLSSALSVLHDLGLEIPALGLAKRQETIILPDALSGYKSIQLDKSSPVSLLLQRIRNEAHRFAVSYHGQLKVKRQTASGLEDIPGIGPTTRKKLVRVFGSLRGVVLADQGELEKVVGISKARQVRLWIKEDGKQSTG